MYYNAPIYIGWIEWSRNIAGDITVSKTLRKQGHYAICGQEQNIGQRMEYPAVEEPVGILHIEHLKQYIILAIGKHLQVCEIGRETKHPRCYMEAVMSLTKNREVK